MPDGSPLPSYHEALAWLYARHRGQAPRDPRRMQALMRSLRLPSPSNLVHVVGTNGKGTVTTMIDAGLRAWGLHSGRFLSPHVEDFRERVAVAGRPLSRQAVQRFVAWAQRLAPEPAPAFFEWTLALALATFHRARAPWAVIEAGVGGARDATRALGGVRLVVLTNVTPDHLETLGSDVASIARDKAGAFRPGIPAVTGTWGEALQVARSEAARLGVPLSVDDGASPLFRIPDGAARPAPARRRNARLAAAALRLLGAPEEAVLAGISSPPPPARGERFEVRGREVLLDGAHDPAAAALLASELEPGYVLLFGALRRKQGEATLAVLERRAAHVILTEAVAGEALPTNLAGRDVHRDPADALEAALARCSDGSLVVAAGSLYLAGRLRPLLRKARSPRERHRAKAALPGPAASPRPASAQGRATPTTARLEP